MRGALRHLGRFVAAVVLAAAAGIAAAELEVGQEVPRHGGQGVLGAEEVVFENLRGKIVVVQLAHTTSEPSQSDVKPLNELLERLGGKGLVVVGLFEEGKDAVEKFVAEQRPAYPVVYGARDMRKRFGILKGFPTTYVVDSHGKVAEIANFVAQVSVKVDMLVGQLVARPWLPEKYAAIAAQLDSRDYAGARTALATALAAEGLEEGDKARLSAVVEWLAQFGSEDLAAALALRDQGDWWEARNALVQVSGGFKGLASGDGADAALTEMAGDRKIQREIDAGDFFVECVKEAQTLEVESPKKAAAALKKVVTKYRGTKAAEKAADLVERLLR